VIHNPEENPMKIITLQPSAITDRLLQDGTELTQLPYPWHVTESGAVLRQEFWQGDPTGIVGFQRDPHVQRVDLWWEDVAADPQRAVGMYPVARDSKGNLSSHLIAIESVSVTETPES
jgi:hypothetical protein